MRLLRSETVPVRAEADILLARQIVRAGATELGFSSLELTKMVTAASELSRNMLVHGGGGTLLLEVVETLPRRGLRLTFEDQGSGIADIAQAMTPGFSTSRSMGLGLSGSKQLVDDFDIVSQVGVGTRIVVTRWK